MLNATALLLFTFIAVGIGIFLKGLRGQPEWTSPTCAKCRYNLRQLDAETTRECPECGADLHRPGAVRFGRTARNRKLMIGGVVIALIPLLIIGGSMLQRTLGINPLQFRSNASLIAELATNPMHPHVWDELLTGILRKTCPMRTSPLRSII